MRIALALLLTTCASLSAGTIALENDIYTSANWIPSVAASYHGPGDAGRGYSLIGDGRGAVHDGAQDAYDDFGSWYVHYAEGADTVDLGGLSLYRKVDALDPLSTYRFLDTFTNNGDTTFTGTLVFNGDLGSDLNTVFESNTDSYAVTSDGGAGGDPVLAHIWTNNGFSRGLAYTDGSADAFAVGIPVTLAPGQSINLLIFDVLVKQDPTDFAGDKALALLTAQNLSSGPLSTGSPYLAGLSGSDLSGVANFSITATPEPATWSMGLCALSFALLRLRAKRR